MERFAGHLLDRREIRNRFGAEKNQVVGRLTAEIQEPRFEGRGLPRLEQMHIRALGKECFTNREPKRFIVAQH
ncbi:MAG: hypothetical protein AAF658_05550, partial [Myxococcota bacterium]